MAATAPRKAPHTRLTSALQSRAELVVELQARLQEMGAEIHGFRIRIDRELARDAADDRQRLVKYVALRESIPTADTKATLARLRSLVIHVETDEYVESQFLIGMDGDLDDLADSVTATLELVGLNADAIVDGGKAVL